MQDMLFDHIEEKEAAKRAAMIELNGHRFYSMFADRTPDARAREVFKTLAADELKHLKAIEKKYFQEAGFTDLVDEEELAIEDYIAKSGAADIFTRRINVDRLVGLVDTPHKALILALDTERYSVEYFEKLAGRSKTYEGRRFCKELADEERAHVKHIEDVLGEMSR